MPLTSNNSDVMPWQCTLPGCSYKAKLKQELDSHFKSHKPEPELRKPYGCSVRGCHYSATTNSGLKSHVERRHTPGRSKDFLCVMCPSKYYSKTELNRHIKATHVQEKIFQCHDCQYKSSFSTQLRKHVENVHEKYLTFTCSFFACKFRTHHQASLFKHLKKKHPLIPEHPHPCTFPGCEHRSKCTSELAVHIRKRHNTKNMYAQKYAQ